MAKKTLVRRLLYFATFLLLFSCQRELSFEQGQTAKGTMRRAMSDDCLRKNVSGTYVAGSNLGDTNFIEVEVNVSKAGAYTIATNNVNGYSFKSTGTFPDTGTYFVKLTGAGTPAAAGNDVFTITFDSSSCTLQIPVLSVVDTAASPASFTLQGEPGTCLNAAVYGSYVKDAALDTANHIAVMVNVTKPGTYDIATNTVNGFVFSANGTFSTRGIQTINLAASGKPLLSGETTFAVAAGGASSCTIKVTVIEALAVTNPDHFPLTANSFWLYDDLYTPADSLGRTVMDSVMENGKLYKIMNEETRYKGSQAYLFRKLDTSYYEYGSVDKYTTTVVFKPQIKKEILFLKEGLSTGETWFSDEYSGPTSFGQTIFIKYKFTCMGANSSAVINGKTFADVYKIRMQTQLRSEFGDYSDAGEQRDVYYAKGVGIIYAKFTVQSFTKAEWQLRNWLVN